MRLFTGIAVPEQVAAELARFTDPMRLYANLRWVKPEKLHITTAFIGEWPEDRLEEIQTALGQMKPEIQIPIPVQVARIAWMPSFRFARAIYASVGPYDELAALAAATGETLSSIGVALEDRVYRPHITLARIKGRPDLSALNRQVSDMANAQIARFGAASFHLYLSANGTYTKLQEYPL